ncbi:hypothetical protein [Microbispora bryophytorum]|uniref:hypothetical protein n=1 Tax=Microbispora bryophytorum TaxID=1460882 RepID=UPI0033D5E661
MSGDGEDLWPVLPSEIVADTLADPVVPADVFSTVAALTVAICEGPWLAGSDQVGTDPDWREILIPQGVRHRRVPHQPEGSPRRPYPHRPLLTICERLVI